MDDLTELADRVARAYAARFGTPEDSGWLLHKLSEEVGEVHGAWLRLHGQSRGTASRQDLADEVADVLGFLLVFARREGIDPAAAVTRKWGGYLPKEDRG